MSFKLKITFLILFCLYAFDIRQASGQRQLDSLLNIWMEKRADQNFSQDTNAVHLLNDISRIYLYDNSDSAQYYARSAYTLAINQEFKSGKAWALNNLGSAYYVKGAYDNALEAYLRSLRIFEELGNQNRVLWAYNNLGLI